MLSRGCTCLRSALPLARARSAPTEQNRYSPTDFTLHRCYGAFKGVHLSQVHQPSNKCLLFCWCSCDSYTPWVGRNAIPSYICEHPCHLWEALLCKRFCVFGAFRGSFFTACSVGAAETAAPPGGIHRSSVQISPHHHLTTTTSFHHLNTLSPRTLPPACPPNTAGTTSSPPAAR